MDMTPRDLDERRSADEDGVAVEVYGDDDDLVTIVMGTRRAWETVIHVPDAHATLTPQQAREFARRIVAECEKVERRQSAST